MEEQTSANLTVICKHDQTFLGNGGNLPFAVMPTPEEIVQDWAERDPSLHYFFVEISTDVSGAMSVEDYKELKAAEEMDSDVDAGVPMDPASPEAH